MRPHAMHALAVILAIVASTFIVYANINQPIIPQLSKIPSFSVTTIPSNGDLNPYGVAFVPTGFPAGSPLHPGDVLVSNFNASSNLQGTGTTIVSIDPNGNQSLFFQGHGNVGLTTALGVLGAGFVLVGSVPTNTPAGSCRQEPSGEETGVGEGELLILDAQAQVVSHIHSQQFLNGPWDLTIHDRGTTAQVFVSNARSASVTRLDLAVNAANDQVTITKMTQIASGYVRRCDPNALVVGPTGVALDPTTDTLYVASTGDNAVYAVATASSTTSDHGRGTIVIQDPMHLHGPLGLVRAPNGDLLTAQGDAVNPDSTQPSEIVEYTSTGQFVAQFSVDAAQGSAFGLALETSGSSFRFVAVNDALNVLDMWLIP